MKQGVYSFFAIFKKILSVPKRNITKYGKHLAKDEEKPCPTKLTPFFKMPWHFSKTQTPSFFWEIICYYFIHKIIFWNFIYLFFLNSSWIPETRRFHVKKKMNVSFGRKMKWQNMSPLLSASFTTMLCSWPFWLFALFTFWEVFLQLSTTLELWQWLLELWPCCLLAHSKEKQIKNSHFL